MSGPVKTPENCRPGFWKRFGLDDLSQDEWEALCDGCAKCCLLKLEDEDTEQVHYTNIACRLLDDQTCRCGQYALRRQLVAGCVIVTPENIGRIAHWMPATCAYRLLHEGKPLLGWHPLVSGSQDTVHSTGISVRGKTVAEYEVSKEDMEDYICEGYN